MAGTAGNTERRKIYSECPSVLRSFPSRGVNPHCFHGRQNVVRWQYRAQDSTKGNKGPDMRAQLQLSHSSQWGRSLVGLPGLAGEPTVKQILDATWWTSFITASQPQIPKY